MIKYVVVMCGTVLLLIPGTLPGIGNSVFI